MYFLFYKIFNKIFFYLKICTIFVQNFNMKQTKEKKVLLPNRIPENLLESCTKTANRLNLSRNKWLQLVLIKAVKDCESLNSLL